MSSSRGACRRSLEGELQMRCPEEVRMTMLLVYVRARVQRYRRGKPESNDVDIVFTHPDAAKVKGLCKRFVGRLHERGMVTHVMRTSNPLHSLLHRHSSHMYADVSSFHGHNPLRTHHWDSLEKALTVFILPPSSPFHNGTRRRLDLIFAPPDVYWTAVIGW